MPPAQFEIVGSAERQRGSLGASASTSSGKHGTSPRTSAGVSSLAPMVAASNGTDKRKPPAQLSSSDPPTAGTGNGNGFKLPKIQRDRNPAYAQSSKLDDKDHEDDEEEEEGAITNEPSLPKPPKESEDDLAPQPTAGPSRPPPAADPTPVKASTVIDKPEATRRVRSPLPSRSYEQNRDSDGQSSSRRGDGGFFSATRIDRDRYRDPEERDHRRDFDDRSRTGWDRVPSPPGAMDGFRRASQGYRDRPIEPRYDGAWQSDWDRDRSSGYASRGPSYRPVSPLPAPGRGGYLLRSPSPPSRTSETQRDRAYEREHRSAWDTDGRNGRSERLNAYGDVNSSRDRPPRALSPGRDRDLGRDHGWSGREGGGRVSSRSAEDDVARSRTKLTYDSSMMEITTNEGSSSTKAGPSAIPETRSVVPRKRSRSPSLRSPPAGLLKRKANFTAIQAPEPGEKPAEQTIPHPPPPPLEAGTAAASHPSSASQPSSSLASPQIGPATSVTTRSALSSANRPFKAGEIEPPHPAINGAASQLGSADPHPIDKKQVSGLEDGRISKVASVCEALDDPSSASVKLSCAPRDRGALSGPQRRRARPPPVPLNERKFYGCSSLDDYEITVKLGQGTFGEVKKGRHIATGMAVALKKVTIHDEQDGMPITALREVKLLKKLSHPAIVPVVDMAYRPPRERGKLGDVYMVEPYMDHDLNGMLDNPNIRLEHSQIKLYMKQLLEGTLYLHKNRVLHRDMKAANLLINNEGQLQIADFGLARPYRDPGQGWKARGWQGGLNKYTNMVVTRWYRPPELLAGEKKYGPPIDMWGIGCILAEMVTGKPIFKGTSEINQLELISKLCGSPNEDTFPGWSSLPGVKNADPSGRPDPAPLVAGRLDFGNHERTVKTYFRTVVDVGPECADLIDKLLVLDPCKRLTASEALDHDWFWAKPFPADPASLPKYDPSKELDRTKRDWKPTAAQRPPPPAPMPPQAPPPLNQGYGMGRPPPLGGVGGGGGGGGMGANYHSNNGANNMGSGMPMGMGPSSGAGPGQGPGMGMPMAPRPSGPMGHTGPPPPQQGGYAPFPPSGLPGRGPPPPAPPLNHPRHPNHHPAARGGLPYRPPPPMHEVAQRRPPPPQHGMGRPPLQQGPRRPFHPPVNAGLPPGRMPPNPYS